MGKLCIRVCRVCTSFDSRRVSLSVDSLTVSGSSCSEDSLSTNILYQPASASSAVGPAAVSHGQSSAPTGLPVISAELTLRCGRTCTMPSPSRAAEEGEGTEKEMSIFDHNLKLGLQQTVLFVDKETVLKLANLISLLNGGFNTE